MSETTHEITWQPIETAPKDGRGLLLSDGESVTVGWWEPEPLAAPNGDSCWCEMADVASVYEPTHWMPLPVPPIIGAETDTGEST